MNGRRDAGDAAWRQTLQYRSRNAQNESQRKTREKHRAAKILWRIIIIIIIRCRAEIFTDKSLWRTIVIIQCLVEVTTKCCSV